MNAPLVLWIDDPSAPGDPTLGGKFASLAEMAAAGFQVPPGFGITTTAYRSFLAHAGLEDQVREVRRKALHADLATIERLSAEIAAVIDAAPLPADLEEAVRGAYAELAERSGEPDPAVAVRSSGESEDLAGASFAGQYDTFLWVSGIDDVLVYLRRCWAGMFGAAVLTYRPGGDEETADHGMCVGIQQMVPARSAGVMFTLDPVTGDRSKVVIEGCWGLGEGVVSGTITPSRFTVDKVTFDLLESVTAVQQQMFALDQELAVVGLVEVPEDRQETSCLNGSEISELARLAKRIEQHRGAPQDIEWAVTDDGEVRVLQVRPETVWSSRLTEEPTAKPATAIDQVLARFAGTKVTRTPGAS
jgi:pyruvate,water dikinase